MWRKNSNADLLSAVYRKDQPAILKLLKQRGIEINWVDEDGRSTLMHAILADQPGIEILKLLIENGADVKLAEPVQKWTALHLAARDGNAEFDKLLLEHGAEVDAQDVFGNTPLWRAVMNFKGDDRAIRVLLAHGANKNQKNKHGVSPWAISQDSASPGIAEVFHD